MRNAGSRKGDRFVCVPIGIRPGGLQIEARQALELTAYDPLSGAVVASGRVQTGPAGHRAARPWALVILGRVTPNSCSGRALSPGCRS